MNNQPIGVFDSGIGGLSILTELVKLLPHESFIYYADQKNCPYGGKSEAEIQTLSTKIVDLLIGKDCKTVVIACNTATSAAIALLRDTYSIPFVGIEPALKPAAQQSKSRKIAILATNHTLNGKKFEKLKNQHGQRVELLVKNADVLVTLAERREWNTKESNTFLKNMISPMIENQVDQLVLGCTHYAFFLPEIEQLVKSGITVINPAPAVAKRTVQVLRDNLLMSNKSGNNLEFFSSGNPEQRRVMQLILNEFFILEKAFIVHESLSSD